MWQCPKCGAEVKDSLELCWICGTAADGTEYPGLQSADDPGEGSTGFADAIKVGFLRRIRLPQAVGVPRRFGLSKLLAMTALFGGLFGVMSWLDTPPIIFVALAVFFMGVGAAQMLLFGGKAPRIASVVAGLCLGPLIALVTLFGSTWAEQGSPDAGIVCFAFGMMLFGSGLGYLAGGLIAGIFLLKDREMDESEDG